MRERRHRLRGCLSDRVGRRVAHHDFIPVVHDRQIHGTPRISEPRVQARNARYEKRPFGVQSGWYSLTRLTSIFISGNVFFFRSLVRHPYIFFKYYPRQLALYSTSCYHCWRRTHIRPSTTYTGPVHWAILWAKTNWPPWSRCWWRTCSAPPCCPTSCAGVRWRRPAWLVPTRCLRPIQVSAVYIILAVYLFLFLYCCVPTVMLW